jgi:hypothetical protein
MARQVVLAEPRKTAKALGLEMPSTSPGGRGWMPIEEPLERCTASFEASLREAPQDKES